MFDGAGILEARHLVENGSLTPGQGLYAVSVDSAVVQFFAEHYDAVTYEDALVSIVESAMLANRPRAVALLHDNGFVVADTWNSLLCCMPAPNDAMLRTLEDIGYHPREYIVAYVLPRYSSVAANKEIYGRSAPFYMQPGLSDEMVTYFLHSQLYGRPLIEQETFTHKPYVLSELAGGVQPMSRLRVVLRAARGRDLFSVAELACAATAAFVRKDNNISGVLSCIEEETGINAMHLLRNVRCSCIYPPKADEAQLCTCPFFCYRARIRTGTSSAFQAQNRELLRVAGRCLAPNCCTTNGMPGQPGSTRPDQQAVAMRQELIAYTIGDTEAQKASSEMQDCLLATCRDMPPEIASLCGDYAAATPVSVMRDKQRFEEHLATRATEALRQEHLAWEETHRAFPTRAPHSKRARRN